MDTSVLLDLPPAPIGGEMAVSAASLAGLHYGVLVARTEPADLVGLETLVEVVAVA